MARDQRRLAAIVSADVAGYSRLMGEDESRTLAALKAHRRELIDPKIAEYGGRIVKTTGDGLLLDFPSVVEAVRCAVDVQRGMAERNAGVPLEQRIEFRIGINVGDIIIDGDDIFGDGVNIAARLQALSEPGEICVSKGVRDQVVDKLSFTFEELGAQQVKHIARPVEAYRVYLGSEVLQRRSRVRWSSLMRGHRRWVAASVLALLVAGAALWALPQFWKADPATSPPPFSIAVLPFTTPGGGTAEEQFAEALTTDLTGAVGRVKWTRVASQSAAAAYKGKARDDRDIGRGLNVRYLVEGEVRRDGEQTAVTARLIDAGNATQLWSDRVTVDRAQMAQGPSIVLELSAAVYEAIERAEQSRVSGPIAPSANATDLVSHAFAVWGKDPTSVNATREARKQFDQALQLDPNLVLAMNGRAETLLWELLLNIHADHDRLVREMDEITTRAVNAESNSSLSWLLRSNALSEQWRWEAALEANARARRLSPTHVRPLIWRAQLMILTGHPTEALSLVDQALARPPNDNQLLGYALLQRCNAYLFLGRYEEAIEACERAVGEDDWWLGHLYLVAAYAQKGKDANAGAEKTILLKQQPGVSIADLKALRFSNDPTYLQQTETYLYVGLRKAGIPEQ